MCFHSNRPDSERGLRVRSHATLLPGAVVIVSSDADCDSLVFVDFFFLSFFFAPASVPTVIVNKFQRIVPQLTVSS